jgi:integrase/recombinase XerD
MNRLPTMLDLVADYLHARRDLGYQLRSEGEELKRFARFADSHEHRGPLTTELALSWATASKKASPLSWARRLEIVRGFARYRFIFDPATEIPPVGLLGSAHRRVTPYIYSEPIKTGIYLAHYNLLNTPTTFLSKGHANRSRKAVSQ